MSLSLIVRMLITFSAYYLEQNELVSHMFILFPMWHMLPLEAIHMDQIVQCGHTMGQQANHKFCSKAEQELCCGPSEEIFRSQKYKHDYQWWIIKLFQWLYDLAWKDECLATGTWLS